MSVTISSPEALNLLSAAIMAGNESGEAVAVHVDRLAYTLSVPEDAYFEALDMAYGGDFSDPDADGWGDDFDVWGDDVEVARALSHQNLMVVRAGWTVAMREPRDLSWLDNLG